MSFYSDASLVMIPSGYKTSKVYSAVPTDGAGDLSFSRSNDTATRVNSAGLIEKVRTNITLYSNDFSQWTKNNTTITSDSIVGPFGTDSADLMTLQSTTDEHNVYYSPAITTSANNAYTHSFYVKKGTGRYVAAWMYFSSNLGGPYATYDLDTNTLAASGTTAAGTTYINSSIEVLSGGWIRISVTGLSSSSTSIIPAIDARTSGSLVPQVAFLGAGQTYYIYGAQLELSDFGPTAYIATTSSAVSVGPVANVPRLDYLNSSCPRLLLEPQRTNLALYSEQWDNAYWSKFNDSVTANAGTSPDGYTNADKEIPNTSNDIHGLIRNVGSQSAGAYTASVFIKAAGYNFGYLRFTTDTDAKRYVIVVNLTTGVVTATNSFGSPVSPSYKVDNYGNGWFRLSVTLTHGSGDLAMMAGSSSSGTPTFAASIPSFAGDGTSGVLLYGAMTESGAYATSYIPTLGAAVTRGADNNVQVNPSTLVGATAGSWFMDVADYEFNIKGTTLGTSWIGDSDANFIGFTARTGGFDGIIFAKRESSTVTILYDTASKTLKACFTWNGSSLKLFVDGVKVYDNNSFANFAAWDTFQLNYASREASYKLNQTLLFPTQLSDADAIALTA